MKQLCVCMLALLMCAGCQTAPKKAGPATESADEVVSAIGSMTEGLTNQSVSKEDLKRLAVEVQKDPETRSAVNAVNSAFNIEASGVKYCPVDGKRFSSRLDMCPTHHIKLLTLDE